MYQKNCDYCGREFLAKRRIDIYCSPDCREAGAAGKARKRTALWRKANPDRAKNAIDQWRKANPEKAQKRVLMWHKTHPEERRAHRAKYRETHQEQIKKSKAEWVRKNLEKAILYLHRRRAKKAGSDGSYTNAEWQELKARYNHQCLACGRTEPEIRLTVDHVIPLQLGGSNGISNIQPLCDKCNKRKGTQIIDYRCQ